MLRAVVAGEPLIASCSPAASLTAAHPRAQRVADHRGGSTIPVTARLTKGKSLRLRALAARAEAEEKLRGRIKFQGVHHVALLCENLERSLDFYCGVLGLEINPDRPHDKLPYRGAWLWIGPEMIHLMELPNPDPLEGRPTHGGRDRHFCVGVESVAPIEARLEEAGIEFTRSKSGRAAIFFRDPDMNCLECVELAPWR